MELWRLAVLYDPYRVVRLQRVNNGLEKTKNGVGVACSSWFTNIHLEGLKKTMKNLSWKTFRDSNWVLSKYRYSSTVCLASALNWGGLNCHGLGVVTLSPAEGSRSWCGHFIPGKRVRYSLYRWLGGPQGRCGPVRKISLPAVVVLSGRHNPTRSRYTDWAMPIGLQDLF